VLFLSFYSVLFMRPLDMSSQGSRVEIDVFTSTTRGFFACPCFEGGCYCCFSFGLPCLFSTPWEATSTKSNPPCFCKCAVPQTRVWVPASGPVHYSTIVPLPQERHCLSFLVLNMFNFIEAFGEEMGHEQEKTPLDMIFV
jgi:hypothetical protein